VPNNEKTIVDIEFNVDTRSAIRQTSNLQKLMSKTFEGVGKASDKLGQINSKVTKEATEDTEDWIKSLKSLKKYQKEEIDLIRNKEAALRELEGGLDKLDGKAKANTQARIAGIKKELAVQKATAKKRATSALGFNSVEAGKEMKASLGKAADSFKSSMSSFFSKDLKGLGNGLSNLLGKDVLRGAGKAAKFASMSLKFKGSQLKDRGDAVGGAKGAALKAGGAAMNLAGKSMGAVSALMPILATVGNAIAKLVTLFLDADANTKQFNKSVMESASSAEFLGDNMGNAQMASEDLKATLKEIQKSSEEFGYQNTWGIMREDHIKILNTLNQEGLSLSAMKKEAKAAGKGIGQYTQELAKVSIAYSKAFGVPLQEINQFQAELMTEMGMSLTGVQLQFESMARSASESGIATNKFFAIIRGVSQDLSLYNVRMESAVKLLKMLGKVMNPRDAQKFMQYASQGMKNMSTDDRLKVSLLTGEKGKRILDKDLDNRRANLYKDIQGAIGGEVGDIKKRLSDPATAKALWAEVRDKASGRAGALRGEDIALKGDESAAKKGVYGRSVAMRNMGMGASLDMDKAALFSLTGNKYSNITEASGDIGFEKTAEMLGKNPEQIQGMMALEAAVEEQREVLRSQGKDSLAATGSTQDILDTLSKEEQDILKNGTKSTNDFAQEQVKATQSVLEQLQRLLDFLMNQIYGAVNGIYEAFVNSVFGNADSKKMYQEQQKIAAMDEGPDKAKMMGYLKQTAGLNSTARLAKLAELISTDTASSISQNIEGVKTASGATQLSAESVKQLEDMYSKGLSDVPLDVLKQSATSSLGMTNVDSYETKDELIKAMETAMKEQRAGIDAIAAKAVETKGGVDLAFSKYGEDRGTLGKMAMPTKILQSGVLGGALDRVLGDSGTGSAGKAKTGIMAGLGASTAMKAAGYSDEEITKVLQELQRKMVDPKVAENSEAFAKNTSKSIGNLNRELFTPGTAYFKMPPNELNGHYQKAVHDAVLEAARTALFEYFMYSGMDRQQVSKMMQDQGTGIQEFAQGMGETALTGDVVSRQAFGGVAVGRDGPMARMAPPPSGEAYAAIKPGEEIVPAYARGKGSGGAQHVIITLDPNAQKMFRAEVTNGIYDYKKQERNT
jgi:hypothetical protein